MAINLVLCGDRRVLWGLAVTVRSALEHTSVALNIHVLCTGFTDADKRMLSSSWKHNNCGAINFKEISSDRTSQFRSTRYLRSKSAYSRYFIGEAYPDIARCVYVDTDFLILRDLAAVAHVDLAGKMAGVVRDISVRVRPAWPELKARLNLNDESNYFNSGFMLIDLDSWRKAKVQEKLVKVSIERFDSLHSQDQDALNIVLEDKVLFLDVSWNTSQYERPALHETAIHLIGKVKPWHACYKKKLQDKYLENAIYNTFYQFLDRTEYRGYRPWDPAGIGAFLEYAGACVPTWDMVHGKVRRMLKRMSGYYPKAGF